MGRSNRYLQYGWCGDIGRINDYYERFEAFPIIRAVCKNVGQDKTCQYQQFPDPITAWKVAGLPRPTPEVLAKIRH